MLRQSRPGGAQLKGRDHVRQIFRRLASFAAVCAIAFGAAQPAFAVGLIRDAEIETTLKKLSTPIFQAANLPVDSVQIYILNSQDINAFAFGGHNMAFNTGMLAELETPEELMGVMAHEAGHLAGGHLTRRAINIKSMRGPLMLGMLLSAAAGVAARDGRVAVAGVTGTQSALQRNLLAYSRAEESAADQAAASFMEKAGIDPASMVKVLQRFRGQEVFQAGHVDPYAISHPLSTERMALLEERVTRSSAKGGKVSPDLGYWHERMRAKLSAFTRSPRSTLSRLEAAEDPDSELNTLRRAIALHLLPDPNGALSAIDKLIAMRPDDAYYWELKGQILFESGRGAEAVAPYRRAVALAPQEALIRGGLGRALLALNDPNTDSEALKTLEESALNGAEEPAILRDLALAYARAGEEGKAALATAERYALTGDPKDALIHARRALDQLPHGSPGWLKADDIRAVAERAINDK